MKLIRNVEKSRKIAIINFKINCMLGKNISLSVSAQSYIVMREQLQNEMSNLFRFSPSYIVCFCVNWAEQKVKTVQS